MISVLGECLLLGAFVCARYVKIVSTHWTRKSFVALEGCFTFGAISNLLYLPGDGGIGLADLALLGHDVGLQHGGEIVVGDHLPSGDRGDVVVALDQHGLSVQVDMHGGLALLAVFLDLDLDFDLDLH